MRSEGYSSCFVILSVCLSVTTFSAATSNKTANKQYEWVQCHTDFIFKKVFFCKNAAFVWNAVCNKNKILISYPDKLISYRNKGPYFVPR